jgi:hypothetical protein
MFHVVGMVTADNTKHAFGVVLLKHTKQESSTRGGFISGMPHLPSQTAGINVQRISHSLDYGHLLYR